MLKLQIIGNIGSDARCGNVKDRSVLNFSVAHNEKTKDANGETQEQTVWVDCALWDREALEPYLKKGKKVFVEGLPSAASYNNSNGEMVTALKLSVHKLELM
ncbi:single-stranded DNA-binding protein [Chitinophaga caeni]|uniref:Single-stranded DNA-binding protein n=1 Tax=Chitinophaga caeni TaxID=2029983 RepID=A0A291R010_9BACT|nr:single-stranded DNA-binding protein [Chitinophaga caeni]ATL49537.1 single-stranded DNA-binding protein [Chitinophaga caeni]